MLLLCILVSPLLPHGQVMTLFALLAAVSGQLLTMLSSLIHGRLGSRCPAVIIPG